MLSGYFTHSVKVERETDLIIDGATTASAINGTYQNDVVLEIQPAAVTGTYTVLGYLDGVTQSEVLTFSNSLINKKVTTKKFDQITSVTPGGAASGAYSGRLRTPTGAPYLSRTTVYSSLSMRLDSIPTFRVGIGSVAPQIEGERAGDKVIGFTDVGAGLIRQRDILTDLANNKEYEVLDTNEFSDSIEYRHTELIMRTI